MGRLQKGPRGVQGAHAHPYTRSVIRAHISQELMSDPAMYVWTLWIQVFQDQVIHSDNKNAFGVDFPKSSEAMWRWRSVKSRCCVLLENKHIATRRTPPSLVGGGVRS